MRTAVCARTHLARRRVCPLDGSRRLTIAESSSPISVVVTVGSNRDTNRFGELNAGMDTAVRSGGPHEDADRRMTVIGAIDVGLLTGIILVGFHSHGGNMLTEPLAALETVAPFIIGWLTMAFLADIYSSGISSSVARAARVTTVVWVAAANVGLLLRASPLFDGTVDWPFPLVITGFGLLVLGSWRIGYAAYTSSQS